jgi:small subunit ribosomal protein S6
MKREYEIAVVVRLESNEEATNDAINQVKAWIEADDQGNITNLDAWGRRRLAYEIDGQREGYYIIMTVDLDPDALDELERNLRLAESVLRYLVIRPD